MVQQNNHCFYKEHPKTCAPDDFWGQVKRTVNGKPISQEQIDLIVNAILTNLKLEKKDLLLDLGCGNAALSQYFYPYCGGMLGVDFSPYLIQVAKNNFERPPHFMFLEDDIAVYVQKEQKPHEFTKVLCYAAFPYLTHNNARIVLETIHKRFVNVGAFFIGNLPDKERIRGFYPQETNYKTFVDDNTNSIGIWRTKSEMKELAQETGWDVEFHTMPERYYASHYRYDVLLRRNSGG